MVSRIRYNKNEHLLTSRETFIKEGLSYTITIDTQANTATLSNPNGVVETMNGVSLHDLKLKAKAMLKRLGFNFKKERRDTRKIVI